MTIGTLWEFFEYGGDKFLKFDMQKDTLVKNISTVYLDDTKTNKVISIFAYIGLKNNRKSSVVKKFAPTKGKRKMAESVKNRLNK